MNSKRGGLSLRLSAAIAAALLGAPLAHAQNPPPDAQKPNPPSNTAKLTTLPTITVTATRRSQTLQDVPL
ncbi:MAG TPA: hypothetical protein VJ862_08000, partial [Rhodanobacteraceae bacterium]|nr:hypothetical protein [Rhodanobacteraceae bacterium]